MADVTISLHIKCSLLDRGIYPKPAFTMQQTACDPQICFDYRLSFAKCFFRFISASPNSKEEKRTVFY